MILLWDRRASPQGSWFRLISLMFSERRMQHTLKKSVMRFSMKGYGEHLQ